jgi:thiol-disulfide isomerase/thioredoxin
VDGWSASVIDHLAVPLIGMASSAAIGLWYRQRRGVDFLSMLAKIVLGALLVARLAFVLQNRDTYGTHPLAILDIADGGFSDMAGLFTAFVIGAELTRHAAAARRPVIVTILAGILVWVIGTVATLDFAPARTTVPLVAIKRLDGSSVQLRTFTDKPMVVNLWATWCPPCRREMPVLRDAQRRYPDISFVFVNQGEGVAAIQSYLSRQHLDIDNVFSDPVGAVAQRMATYAYPTTLFFDSEGVLFMRQVGELNPATLDERLAMLRKARR